MEREEFNIRAVLAHALRPRLAVDLGPAPGLGVVPRSPAPTISQPLFSLGATYLSLPLALDPETTSLRLKRHGRYG